MYPAASCGKDAAGFQCPSSKFGITNLNDLPLLEFSSLACQVMDYAVAGAFPDPAGRPDKMCTVETLGMRWHARSRRASQQCAVNAPPLTRRR